MAPLTGPDAQFRRFWWGEAVSGLGSAITFLALQTIVLVTLSGDATQVGWFNATRFLPYLVLGLVVGALVDRVRRRPVMIVTDLARAALLAVVPLAAALDVLTFPLLLAVVLLFGTASLVNDAASQSFVPRLVPRERLQRAHARLDAADAVAQTGGPAVAGALIRVVGAPVSVLVDAATYLFSALMLSTLREVAEPAAPAPTTGGLRSLGAEVRDGAHWVYRGSGLRRLALTTHLSFAGQATLLVAVVPFAYFELRLSALEVGLAFAVGGVGALVGASTTTALGRRVGTGGAIIASNAANAAGVVVMLLATCVPTGWAAGWAGGWAAAAVLATGQLVYGWGIGAGNSHEMSFRQSLTPDGLQARTNTTMRSINRAVVVVVSPLAGLLADRAGLGPALAVAAGVFAVSAATLALSSFRHVRV